MKANELRIGNIINIHREFPDVWQNGISISENDMMCILDGSTWEPIPLSEEWLIKFGFERQFWGGEYIKENSLFMLCKVGGDHSIHQVRYANIGMLQCFPRYVHQLQNLYFALTGEELTIKEPIKE